ncbi:MAG: hypothetical protein AABX85_00580 [Nanoarchaeota archaeon]
MAKKVGNLIGRLAFLAGFILAIVLGALDKIDQTWTIVLVIIGLLIGLLNIAGKESYSFLLSGISLILASALGLGVMNAIPFLARILVAILAIFVPATIIVAVRNVFGLAKN